MRLPLWHLCQRRAPQRGEAAAAAARVPIKEDHDDGEAHHRWTDGSEYFGEWHGGQPNGRGIFVWPSGDMSSPSGMQITWKCCPNGAGHVSGGHGIFQPCTRVSKGPFEALHAPVAGLHLHTFMRLSILTTVHREHVDAVSHLTWWALVSMREMVSLQAQGMKESGGMARNMGWERWWRWMARHTMASGPRVPCMERGCGLSHADMS